MSKCLIIDYQNIAWKTGKYNDEAACNYIENFIRKNYFDTVDVVLGYEFNKKKRDSELRAQNRNLAENRLRNICAELGSNLNFVEVNCGPFVKIYSGGFRKVIPGNGNDDRVVLLRASESLKSFGQVCIMSGDKYITEKNAIKNHSFSCRTHNINIKLNGNLEKVTYDIYDLWEDTERNFCKYKYYGQRFSK
jgi:hypothetical protein